jgi:signal transduction histidine kinase
MIGSAVRRLGRSLSGSQDAAPAPGRGTTPARFGAAALSGLRDARDRLRVLLDPPDAQRDPGAVARLFGSWRAFARTHVQVTDGALASAVVVAGLVSAVLAHRPAWAAVLAFLLALPLAWRRRAPTTVFLVIAAVALAQWLTSVPLLADFALLAALYTVAAYRPQRAAVAAAIILEGGAILAAVKWGQSAVATFVFASGLVVAALVSGLYIRARRLHVAGLVERAARLEFERDQQALLAAAAERARISREMHDVVAHSLAVVVSLANGAAAKFGRDPEQSREAIESISELGRQALADTRRLLTVLRVEDGASALAPQPGIKEIARLVDRAAATGLAVTLTVRGEPVPIAPGLALSAYRIVQEAITNAVKHAEGASTVAVELGWTPSRLDIAVTDDGRGAERPGAASGYGLAGMRERAALYGGTATAGRGREGGWKVSATLPITEPAAP